MQDLIERIKKTQEWQEKISDFPNEITREIKLDYLHFVELRSLSKKVNKVISDFLLETLAELGKETFDAHISD